MLARLLIQTRFFHTSPRLLGAPYGEHPIKNFDAFKWPNRVTTFEHYRLPQDLIENEFSYPICQDTMGIRWPGYWFKRKFIYVKEMEPELVVPDLEGFSLKPYVSYSAPDVDNPPFTAKQLFDVVYKDQIKEQFESGKLEKLELDQEEIDKSRSKAVQTGADLFEEHTRYGVRAPIEYTMDIDY